MTDAPDIVERLRYFASGQVSADFLPIMAEAATEIERLRVACAGGLTVAERVTNECARLSEQSNRLVRSSLGLRQRLDATRAGRAEAIRDLANMIEAIDKIAGGEG